MKKINLADAYQPRNKRGILSLAALTVAVSSALMAGCSSDSGSSVNNGTASLPTVVEPTNPLSEVLTGTGLNCDAPLPERTLDASTLAVEGPDTIPSYIVSRDDFKESDIKANAQNTIKRLSAVVTSQDPSPAVVLDPDTNLEYEVHPIVVSYAEQVIGPYALGDGSADIGDPTQIDDMFVSISMDNGKTWKKKQIADTSEKSSIKVSWGSSSQVEYPGHSHKPTMAVNGNNILVAWNDKYCPSGNPFDLVKVDSEDIPYPDDLYKVNGSQGSIDYGAIVAPNDKLLYEVPFSCVWTARGELVDPDGDTFYDIEWRQAEQLTSGTRDSNKIWIDSTAAGFAMTWQEDTEGLRGGKGAGPGEGYSGATTNHGSDIWYTHIAMENFDDVCEDADGVDNVKGTEDDCAVIITGDEIDADVQIAALLTKPVPALNFEYPTRITNNEVCDYDSDKETKLYCHSQYLDLRTEDNLEDTYKRNCIAESDPIVTGNQSGTEVTRCYQDDLDYMTPNTDVAPAAAMLDGDTGASRPALKLITTDKGETVAILAYEETKGLSDSQQGDGVPNNGEGDDTVIALEGKAVYFESFLWDQPVAVSAGRIVNLRAPGVDITQDPDTKEVIVGAVTGDVIYENARRVVISSQVDSCDAEPGSGNPTFAIMYKQGYDTQGGSSDMFIRLNKGFTYDDFETEVVNEVEEGVAYNVSSRLTDFDVDGKPTGVITWTEANLEDHSYTYAEDNTFSPRSFLRGEEIYAGFEFSEIWRQTAVGTLPNNFWINRYVDDDDGAGLAWQGPQKISIVYGPKTSTLDPRFITTPKGLDSGMVSDESNPNVLFMTYGTFDMDSGTELDLYYTRSTDKGKTWEYYVDDGGLRTTTAADYGTDLLPGTDDDPLQVRLAKLAARDLVEEKEVQSLSSPDGSMLFNAWLQETEDTCGNDPWCGLESRGAEVEYALPVAP